MVNDKKSADNRRCAGAFQRFVQFLAAKYCMLTRELCPTCLVNPVAVNYIARGVTHYRNSCSGCLRKKKKLRAQPAAWQRAGYVKKAVCERCNFKFQLARQSVVFYVDGNLKNNNWLNLKTVCLNCQQEVYQSRLGWRAGPIQSDV